MQSEMNPLILFESWREAATQGGDTDIDAMTLATVDAEGHPDARVVLYKGLLEGDILFFTNYESRKGLELSVNPHISLVLYWPKIYRQIRMNGVAARVERAVSETYFATRPRASQLGAWASQQSTVTTEEIVATRYQTYDAQFEGQPVPCPPHWGGYRCTINEWEFWEGGPHRLHSRTRYERDGDVFVRSWLSP